MYRSSKKYSVDVTITNELGLHARAAAKIAVLAEKANSTIWLIKGGSRADASSIIDILTLSCPKGAQITLEIDNQTDTGILTEIVDLIHNNILE